MLKCIKLLSMCILCPSSVYGLPPPSWLGLRPSSRDTPWIGLRRRLSRPCSVCGLAPLVLARPLACLPLTCLVYGLASIFLLNYKILGIDVYLKYRKNVPVPENVDKSAKSCNPVNWISGRGFVV